MPASAQPNVGYNPANYAVGSPQTREAWAIQQASIWAAAYANGSEAFGSQLFSNQFWASIGLPPLPPGAQGVSKNNPNAAVDPAVYQGFMAFATYLSEHPEVAQGQGINVPSLPSGGPIYDDQTRNDLNNAAQNAAANQNNVDVANINNTGANQRNQANIDAAAAHDTWQGGQNQEDRTFTGGQNELQRAHDLAVQNLVQGGMNQRQADELANRLTLTQLDQAGQSARQAQQIAADAQQNELQRNFLAGESERDRTFRQGESEKERIFQGGESEKDRQTQLAIANLTESGMNERQAAELASRMTLQQLQEAGASARNAAQIAAQLQIAGQESADRRYSTDVNADVQRQDITSREGIATADRTSRETIANRQVEEQGREFDLNLVEDRRQFNADLSFKLLQQGVELSRHPVDWIAYQYYQANMGIPLGLNNFAGLASQMGAIPPSGPSAAGPVVGGPAAMDGDTALAQQAGVQAGFVSLTQALQENPGNVDDPFAGPLTAHVTGQNIDSTQGLANVEQMLSTHRLQALPEFGNNPVAQKAMQEAVASANPMAAQQESLPPLPPGMTPPPAGPEMPGGVAGQMPEQQPPAVTSAFGAPSPLVPPATPAATPAATPTPVESSGIFTGTGSATPAAANTTAPATGSGTPQGTSMLQALADQLGIPLEQLQQVVPTELLAGGYSREQILNSPVIQALINGSDKIQSFRTAAPDDRFGQIQAFGIPLGLRGGQDLNAGLLLKGSQANREMIQGATDAAGLYWPDVQQQSFQTAPIGSYDTGAFGKRRF